MGLDNRSTDKNGRIREKRSDAQMKSLKPDYPEFDRFRDNTTLGSLKQRYHAESLDKVRREVRKEANQK